MCESPKYAVEHLSALSDSDLSDLISAISSVDANIPEAESLCDFDLETTLDESSVSKLYAHLKKYRKRLKCIAIKDQLFDMNEKPSPSYSMHVAYVVLDSFDWIQNADGKYEYKMKLYFRRPSISLSEYIRKFIIISSTRAVDRSANNENVLGFIYSKFKRSLRRCRAIRLSLNRTLSLSGIVRSLVDTKERYSPKKLKIRPTQDGKEDAHLGKSTALTFFLYENFFYDRRKTYQTV